MFMEILRKKEMRLKRYTEKAYKYHFVDDCYRVRNAYQEALLTGAFDDDLLRQALTDYPESDTIMSAALNNMSLLESVFADRKISYKWSHLLAELIDPRFVNSLHSTFRICVVNKNREAHLDMNTRNINVFFEILDSITEHPIVQSMKTCHNVENKIAKFVRKEGPKPSNSDITTAENAANTETPGSLLIASNALQPIVPPFVKDDSATGILLTATLSSPTSSYISAMMLLSNGQRIRYSITPGCVMDVRLALFNDIMTGILRKSPEEHSRGQIMPSIRGMKLSSGFYISQTTATPLIQESELETLIALRRQIGNKNPSTIKTVDILAKEHRALCFETTKEACDWLWHFGVRYGGTIAEQMLFGFACFSPLVMSIDEKAAAVSFASMDNSTDEDYVFPRLCGAMRKYLGNRSVMMGLRHGIISASDSLTYRRTKVAFHVKNVLAFDDFSDEEFARIERFSILVNDPTTVNTELNALLETAVTCDDIFVIPWL